MQARRYGEGGRGPHDGSHHSRKNPTIPVASFPANDSPGGSPILSVFRPIESNIARDTLYHDATAYHSLVKARFYGLRGMALIYRTAGTKLLQSFSVTRTSPWWITLEQPHQYKEVIMPINLMVTS